MVKAWVRDQRFADSRLVVVTRGAVAARAGEAPDLGVAAVWGLVRSAQSEHPGRFALVDVDRSGGWTAALGGAFAIEHEPQLALREGVALAPRLVPVPAPSDADDERPFDPCGTVLITGGTGGLGALVARHLVSKHGVRHLLLVSRRGRLADRVAELETELGELGCELRVEACDVSDRDSLATLLASIAPEHPLTGVIHAAGVLDDGVIESLDAGRLRRAMAAKVDGAMNLHWLTADSNLSQFVLFSSAIGYFGAPGLGNYAAANAFLDALAAHRQAHGLPGISLAWGLWATASGMTAELKGIDRARLARLGIAPLSTEHGLELLDHGLQIDWPLLLPVRLDGGAQRSLARVGALPALLRGMGQPRARRARPRSLATRLAGVPEAERDGVVLELVRSHVAVVLGHASPAAIDPQRAFLELGFDSLGAIELRNRLNAATGLRLPAVVVLDCPTPTSLASYIAHEVSANV